MKSFLVGLVAVFLFMTPFWILGNKLGITFNVWEQIGIMVSLTMASFFEQMSTDIMREEKRNKLRG